MQSSESGQRLAGAVVASHGPTSGAWVVRYLDAHAMILRSLTQQQVEAAPSEIWNAFVDLLAMEELASLTLEQRPAHHVFWYESEVQNGGHLQYFENRGTRHLAATVAALGLLGATCQQQVLREAGAMWLSRSRSLVGTAQEFCDTALAGEFNAFDSRFHECSPSLQQCLAAYLEQHQALFVTVT